MSGLSDLKVLFVSSEITPYAKSGGLGDVIGSLPKALREMGVDARVVFPKYERLNTESLGEPEYLGTLQVTLGWRNQRAAVYKVENTIPTYMISNDYYFSRDMFYGYGDDFERFAFFSKAALLMMNLIDFIPDVIHFNDWQTGLGPLFLRDELGGFVDFGNIKTLYTVHNLQYQGLFSRDVLGSVGLNDGYFTGDKLEFYNNISYMKAALVYADAISTVSETYAHEIQTPQYGFGMDGVLREKSYKLQGILNGIDTEQYDPETDKKIYTNFSKDTLDLKLKNKTQLQQHLNLPQRDVPMISIISRLADQKGFDLIGVAIEELLSMDIQLVVLGTGQGSYEHMFRHMAWRCPEKISANIFFNEDLARKIYAGSDMFLMPSLFEPCGLGQLFAMRYGTVPIVRKTGGLADTVTHYNPENQTGNGFVFNDYVANGMMWAVREALNVFNKGREYWNPIVKNAMESDFSWNKSAQKYIDLYLKLKG